MPTKKPPNNTEVVFGHMDYKKKKKLIICFPISHACVFYC